MNKVVECVPNFSEGRDSQIIDQIAQAIRSVAGAELLDVDPGADTNRTVITIVGSPDAVKEAAFQAIAAAKKLIDMSKHSGAHPRMGATDVCPFVPVRNMTMDECVELARELGKRVGEELDIPVYLYEYAASTPKRRNLATIRAGEYEGLMEKIAKPEWKPDFGPAEFRPRSGATVIGARKFLIAYNVNINSRNQRLAHNIALDIRERGRFVRGDNHEYLRDASGEKVRAQGLLQECKAVGWYIAEYQRAQVSINLTDYEVTSVHKAFDTCEEVARKYGLRVTGSELVGLIPLEAMLDAGKHYLRKQNQSTGVPEKVLIQTAVQSLGLDELTPFKPEEKIIEYRISGGKQFGKLVNMTCGDFADELSIDSPAPGGGSVAALCGAMAAGLAAMVGNLTADKREYAEVQAEMIGTADEAQKLKDEFLLDVDRDTDAFNELMECFNLPKNDPEQTRIRQEAITAATKKAAMIPFNVLTRSRRVIDLAEIMALRGNQKSISDAGVGILSAQCAAEGAYLNVMINVADIADETWVNDMRERATQMIRSIREAAEKAIQVVHHALKIG
ncbi:glutamate formimidoyltransferase [bacterium]|nr:glutamate formimidoyltransferase [candidate division CSSED10-310 bacterium]